MKIHERSRGGGRQPVLDLDRTKKVGETCIFDRDRVPAKPACARLPTLLGICDFLEFQIKFRITLGNFPSRRDFARLINRYKCAIGWPAFTGLPDFNVSHMAFSRGIVKFAVIVDKNRLVRGNIVRARQACIHTLQTMDNARLIELGAVTQGIARIPERHIATGNPLLVGAQANAQVQTAGCIAMLRRKADRIFFRRRPPCAIGFARIAQRVAFLCLGKYSVIVTRLQAAALGEKQASASIENHI